MSLLAPARGMPMLSAKDGLSRPSLKPVPASSSNASKHASSAQGSKEAYPSSTLSVGSHRGLWDWDCALLVPSETIAITRPTENISSRWSLAYSSCWAGVYSQRVALTIQFIQINFIGNHNIYVLS